MERFTKDMRASLNEVDNIIEPEYDIDGPEDEDDDNTRLHNAVLTGNEKTVLGLLLKGANVNVTNNNMDSPLHIAVDMGYPNIIELLLQRGAWTEVANSRGLKPIHMVAESTDPMDSLEALLGYETVNVNALDSNRNNILHLMIATPLDCPDMQYVIMQILMNDTEINLNAVNVRGETPLEIALRCNNLRIARALRKRRALLYSPDDRNVRCL